MYFISQISAFKNFYEEKNLESKFPHTSIYLSICIFSVYPVKYMRYNIKFNSVFKEEEEEKILDYRELFAFGETALKINLNFKQYFKQRKFEKKSEIRDLYRIQIIL